MKKKKDRLATVEEENKAKIDTSLDMTPAEEPLLGQEMKDDQDLEGPDEAEHALPIDTADISDWYHDTESAEVDMSKIDQRKKGNKWPWVFGIIGGLVLVAAITFSYAAYRAHKPADKGSGVITMNIPEKTASGEAVTLELTYDNQETVSLRTGKVEVVYPDGFVFQSSDPEPSVGSTIWNVDHLPSGHGGKIYVTGQLVGEVGSTKVFSTFFTYRPENLNYDFQGTAQGTIHITSSTISVSVDSPQRARTGQDIEVKAEFKNTSKTPLKNIKIIAIPPTGFTLTKSDPSLDSSGDFSWRVDELQPDASQTITLQGTVQGDSGQQQAFGFQAGFIEIDGRFNIQVEKQSLILLVNPSIELSLEAPTTASPGDEITYTVTAQNTSDVDLTDVKLRLLLDGDYFADQQIDLSPIETLDAHASQTVSGKTTLKTGLTSKSLDLSAVVSVKSVTIDGDQTTVSGTATTETKVEGSLTFTAQARYFDDNLRKIGDGPVPPQVGEKTTYVIWWDLSSGPSDLKELTVSAVLPDDVTFVSGDPDVIYNKKDRSVSYSASTLKAGDLKHLKFSVSITPVQDDFNSLKVLLEAGAAQAVDGSSKESLTSSVDRLTTNLDGDPAAQGEGVVE